MTSDGSAGRRVALLDERVRLLFVGVNPSPLSAAMGAPFSHASNRFWPALQRSGILGRRIDTSGGFTGDDREYVLSRGVGITSLVRRPTRRAAEVSRAELVAGVADLAATVERFRPQVVAILGVSAYRPAFQEPHATLGAQARTLGDAALWIVPNTSGLNAGTTLDRIAEWFAAAARAAGIPLPDAPG